MVIYRRRKKERIRDRKKIASISNNTVWKRVDSFAVYHGRIVVINYSRTDEDKLKRFQLSLREGRLSYRVISSCHKSFGSSDKLGLKVVIRPLLRRQARKLAPLENVDKATSRRAFPYRHFNNRLKFSLRCLTHTKKKKRNKNCVKMLFEYSKFNFILLFFNITLLLLNVDI